MNDVARSPDHTKSCPVSASATIVRTASTVGTPASSPMPPQIVSSFPNWNSTDRGMKLGSILVRSATQVGVGSYVKVHVSPDAAPPAAYGGNSAGATEQTRSVCLHSSSQVANAPSEYPVTWTCDGSTPYNELVCDRNSACISASWETHSALQ